MEFIKAVFLLLLCSIYHAHCDNESTKKSNSYADFINDVTLSIHQSNDIRLDTYSKLLYDNIQRLILPILYHLVDTEVNLLDDNQLHLKQFNSFLKELSLNDNSSLCIYDLSVLISALSDKNPQAIQFFDATGKPGPGLTKKHFSFIGDYDQCRAASMPQVHNSTTKGFKGNYCDISGRIVGLPMPLMELGACLPSSCTGNDIDILLYEILKVTNTSLPPAVFLTTECLKAPTKVTTATAVAIVILSVIGLMMIAGTVCDLFIQIKTQSKKEPSMITNENSVDRTQDNNQTEQISSNSHNEQSPLINKSSSKNNPSPNSLIQLLLAFSVYTNGKKLLSTKQPSGSLGSIHGIRFLSMSWVVLCHFYAFILSFTVNVMDVMPVYLKRWTFLPIANGFVSVDTFFTLSGLLTSYLTLKEMMRRNTWKINWPLFYFHRFWRLTPPYMLTILISIGLAQYLGEGPFWRNVQPADKVSCEKNWWTNLLYVNNLVNVKEGCFGHSWYLANDMQFFVISPIMLIPFFFHRIAGLASCTIVLLISWIATGVLSTENKWPATTLRPNPTFTGSATWFNHYYIVPWCRIGPFIVGIVAGYILAKTKGRSFRMHWLIAVVGWVLAAASGLAVVYGLRGDITGDDPSTIEGASLYNTVHSSVWGACVAWVIIACSGGYGGPINALLSWSPFVVLGRLTYMTYLIHINIGEAFFENLGSTIYMNDFTMIVLYLGFLTLANMVSFIAVLVLESPMIGLEKTFIRKERH